MLKAYRNKISGSDNICQHLFDVEYVEGKNQYANGRLYVP